MYKDFLNELMKEFPNVEKVKHEKLDSFRFKGDHMKRFTKQTRDFANFITEKNEALFTSECKLVKDIGLDIIWPIASEESKGVIWQYLTTMNMLSTTMSVIPPKMLNKIEKMASKLADDMKGSDEIDFSKIMQNVQQMMESGQFKDMMEKKM
jgi:hypothetical protein